MKKLIKSVICGSVNSAYVHCSPQKVNNCSYCSLNSNRIPKTREKKKKKKKEGTKRRRKRGRNVDPNIAIVYHIIIVVTVVSQIF